MAHYQQHGQQATRVDEYGNPIPGGHGILGQTGEYGAGTGGYGRQAGYGPTGTGVHDDGGYGGSGQPAFGATGTGTHDDAGGVGGYGPMGTGPHVPAHSGAHGLTGTGGYAAGAHTGMLGGAALGTHGPGHGTATGLVGTHGAEHKTAGGNLRRSGSSSSSSSSEDDGMGGRRKKGMKEKVKEKLPGGHKDKQYQQSAATGGHGADSAYTAGTAGTDVGTYADGTHEKKGITDKIKKLPGGHKDEYGQQHTTTATGGGYAPGRTATTGKYGTTEGTHEKKGIMDKIKDKLPGQH